jgi:hypothetical protein
MRRRKLLWVPVAIAAVFVSLGLAVGSNDFFLRHSLRTPGIFAADLILPTASEGRPFDPFGNRYAVEIAVDSFCWLALFGATYVVILKIASKFRDSSLNGPLQHAARPREWERQCEKLCT